MIVQTNPSVSIVSQVFEAEDKRPFIFAQHDE